RNERIGLRPPALEGPFDDLGVRAADRDRPYAAQDLVGPRRGTRDFLDLERMRRGEDKRLHLTGGLSLRAPLRVRGPPPPRAPPPRTPPLPPPSTKAPTRPRQAPPPIPPPRHPPPAAPPP